MEMIFTDFFFFRFGVMFDEDFFPVNSGHPAVLTNIRVRVIY